MLMLRHCAALLLGLLICSPLSAYGAESKADFLMQLFTDACISNKGHPEKVRAWAAAQHLQEMTAPKAIKLFVGDGPNGMAWKVPNPQGDFALSIRGATQGCAAWARTADPAEVTALFKKLIEASTRPNVEIGVESDKTTPTTYGDSRELVYHIYPQSGNTGFGLMLVTVQREGSPMQAELQIAVLSRP
jgi:hypothetical protein